MRLIDADTYKGKCICNHLYCGVTKIIEVDGVPTSYDVDKVIEKLKTELSLAGKEKGRCARENPLQFDIAKGYAQGISVALEIAKSGGVSDD